MTPRHARPTGHQRRDALLRAGVVVFGLGLVAAVVAVVPSILTGRSAPEPVVLLAGGLLPLGLGLALLALLRGARAARHR